MNEEYEDYSLEANPIEIIRVAHTMAKGYRPEISEKLIRLYVEQEIRKDRVVTVKYFKKWYQFFNIDSILNLPIKLT